MKRKIAAHIERLLRELRVINRRIANCRAVSRQEDMKMLKRLRLRLKDRIVALQRGQQGDRSPA